jgi:hypothetical protein
MRARTLIWFLAILTAVASVCAQQTPAPENDQSTTPKVTFTFNWTSSNPQFFKLEVDSTGRAAYTSQSSKDDGEPYSEKFTMGAADRQRIFDLARQAAYLNGNFDFGKHKIAQTGVKTLAYDDATRHHQTTYNWSQNPAINELNGLFTAISNTLESGRRLSFLMRFDKLGLEKELKGMEQAAAAGELRELAVIAPTLQQLASDSGYMHIVQERARHLLKLANP